jgi:hypothetical protein
LRITVTFFKTPNDKLIIVDLMEKYFLVGNAKLQAMLGFVVKCIDIAKNVEKINNLLKTNYTEIYVQDYLYAGIIPNTYISSHDYNEQELIVLTHAFVNCTSIIS